MSPTPCGTCNGAGNLGVDNRVETVNGEQVVIPYPIDCPECRGSGVS